MSKEVITQALAGFPGGDNVDVVDTSRWPALVVGLRARQGVAEEGAFLMALEAHLRYATGEPVEVYLEPLADQNKARRAR